MNAGISLLSGSLFSAIFATQAQSANPGSWNSDLSASVHFTADQDGKTVEASWEFEADPEGPGNRVVVQIGDIAEEFDLL
jgi:hypothetical protein